MRTPILPTLAATLACALATACAAQARDVRQIQRTQYAIDERTASSLVRRSLDEYPLVLRGETDHIETRWVRGKDGTAYKLVVHIDGPGGGPFMVRVEPTLRDRTGAIKKHDIPAWLVAERERVAVEIYERMRPAAIAPEPPATVAGR
ncbi:MAG: hypothetical protein AB7T06_48370 [Kofleriaceae bacterium]